MLAYEVNFDALIGPTHNYAGLSFGNLASERNRGSVSSPKAAALQGLAKMKRLHGLGVKQGVLPPQPRPVFSFLRQMGFGGSAEEIIAQAAANPRLLANAYSASAMWAANAATVSPSADTRDGRVHFTPANLATHLHRSLEPACTALVLQQIFPDTKRFVHHAPLPGHAFFGDEGAANHMRFAPAHGEPGVEMLIYGRMAEGGALPALYPARQTREACQAIVRKHRLDPDRVLLVQQNPSVVDQGVFHNDVISVANEMTFLYHEDAFVDTPAVVARLEQMLGGKLQRLCVKREQVSVQEAVASYLFNSQLVSLPRGGMAVIAPLECRLRSAVKAYLDALPAADDNPVTAVHYFDVRESMQNGGGPACLRLRVVLAESELAAVHPQVLFDEQLYARLEQWVHRHYRDALYPQDLADPALAKESRAALEALEEILRLKILTG
ncbi:MAG: N-succinylarginine dihydrolase [Desulfobacteraceae bacterium]|nr:MAG: N-succinylarginine dihydrolase [Desulfobacteraceae bacterium]